MKKERILKACIVFLVLFCTTLHSNADGIKYTSTKTKFIYSEKDFMTIGSNLSGSYKLMSDIRLTKEFPGFDTFCGYLDGNGYEIKNYYSSNGIPLFKTISTDGIIENLTINGNVFIKEEDTTLYKDTGMFAYVSYGRITNCTSAGRILQEEGTAMDSFAGIVGNNFGLIEECTNSADILCKTPDTAFFKTTCYGGIAARNYGSIVCSVNEGRIEGEGAYAGGITGMSGGWCSSIVDCINYGDVYLNAYVEEMDMGVGGIAGTAGEAYETPMWCLIYNCTNEGTVSVPSNSASDFSVGGIAGSVNGHTEIVSSSNKGKIKGTTNARGTGGICGSMTNWTYPLVDDYINNPRFFVGYLGVLDCKNTGKVSGGDVGGVVGYANNQSGKIFLTRNINKGEISANKNKGNILGLSDADSKAVTISNNAVSRVARLGTSSPTIKVGSGVYLLPANGTLENAFYTDFSMSKELKSLPLGEGDEKEGPWSAESFTASKPGKQTIYALFEDGQVIKCTLTVKENEHSHHIYRTQITPASKSKKGEIKEVCTICGASQKICTIPKLDDVVLSETKFIFTGQKIKPEVFAYDVDGNVVSSKYYEVTYINNNAPGKGIVEIEFTGAYDGVYRREFKISPNETTITKLKPLTGGFEVTWGKKDKITGYEIRYATKDDMRYAKKVFIKGKTKKSKAVKNLGSKKTYYIQVRVYKEEDGKKYFSTWSDIKSVKTK